MQKIESRLFPYEKWQDRLPELSEQFRGNAPFPHIHLDEFLHETSARTVLEQFPQAEDARWIQYKHYNERTLGESKRDTFPPIIGQVVDELNSDEFVKWLSVLIGIPGLLADPRLEGGGMHQTESGGFLNVHADFQMHPHKETWHRRCNLILYLNEGWNDEWGGSIEFWDKQMKSCVTRISPQFNRAVIFNTTLESLHGYPEPIRCPQQVTRKSLALYYYTIDTDATISPNSSTYYSRPRDGLAKRFCIKCDNALLKVYTWAKRTFHLSDRFASWVLKMLSK